MNIKLDDWVFVTTTDNLKKSLCLVVDLDVNNDGKVIEVIDPKTMGRYNIVRCTVVTEDYKFEQYLSRQDRLFFNVNMLGENQHDHYNR